MRMAASSPIPRNTPNSIHRRGFSNKPTHMGSMGKRHRSRPWVAPWGATEFNQEPRISSSEVSQLRALFLSCPIAARGRVPG